MTNALHSFPKIAARLKKTGAVLMLDFDGTLAPIAPRPESAKISPAMKQAVAAAARRFPTAIISGRGLNDIKRKAGIRKVMYAGNHGMEWEQGGRCYEMNLPQGQKQAVRQACAAIKKAFGKDPFILLEDKRLTASVHYRLAPATRQRQIKKDVLQVLDNLGNKKSLRITEGKKVVEIRPNILWNKGQFAKKFIGQFRHNTGTGVTPLYIGDDRTDEDVFAVLRSGITIRVGYLKASRARYFLPNVAAVQRFLRQLAAL